MRSRSLIVGLFALLLAAVVAMPTAAQVATQTATQAATQAMMQGTQAATQGTSENVGFTRFAHTAVDVGPIDIYIGNGSQPLVTNLKYGEFTDYFVLPATLSGYIARAAGSASNSAPLFTLDWGVKSNKSEIVIAAGLGDRKAFALEPLTIVRNDTKGKARVRVFNTVSGGPLLGVSTAQGQVFSQGQGYLNASSDTDLPAGNYTFQVKDAAGKVLYTAPEMTLEADKVYVMLIAGGAEGNPPIQLLTLISEQETTRVKFVNESGSTLDIYNKGQDTPLVVAFSNGTSSPFYTLPSGAVTFVVRDTGSTVSGKELAFLATQLFPGRDLTITITNAGAFQIAITTDVLAVPAVMIAQDGSTLVTPVQPGTAQPTAATGATQQPPTSQPGATQTGTMPATMMVTGTAPVTTTASGTPLGTATQALTASPTNIEVQTVPATNALTATAPAPITATPLSTATAVR